MTGRELAARRERHRPLRLHARGLRHDPRAGLRAGHARRWSRAATRLSEDQLRDIMEEYPNGSDAVRRQLLLQRRVRAGHDRDPGGDALRAYLGSGPSRNGSEGLQSMVDFMQATTAARHDIHDFPAEHPDSLMPRGSAVGAAQWRRQRASLLGAMADPADDHRPGGRRDRPGAARAVRAGARLLLLGVELELEPSTCRWRSGGRPTTRSSTRPRARCARRASA